MLCAGGGTGAGQGFLNLPSPDPDKGQLVADAHPDVPG